MPEKVEKSVLQHFKIDPKPIAQRSRVALLDGQTLMTNVTVGASCTADIKQQEAKRQK
jgi:hypothetical protein